MALTDAYDPWFLGTPLALPDTPRGVETVVLPFAHVTVELAPERRLAILTAVNVDGASLLEIDRGDDWHLDERVGVDAQTGPEVDARNDLDRGHLACRRTRCGASGQSPSRRTSTPSATSTRHRKQPGPPGRAALGRGWRTTTDLSDAGRAGEAPPELGAYLTYQVPVVDAVMLTGLDLAPLVEADRLPVPTGRARPTSTVARRASRRGGYRSSTCRTSRSERGHTTPYSRSPASPSPGTM